MKTGAHELRSRALGIAAFFLLGISPSQITGETNAPSLDELKVAGAVQSKYRTFPAQALEKSPTNKAPEANLAAFRQDVAPLLKAACSDCHGPDTQEGNIRVDALDPDLFHGNDVDWWIEVLAVLSNGEMPPEDADELSDADRSKIVEWLTSEIQVASMVRRAEGGHSSFRRMTRYEYKYALQDLLGLPYDFAKDLPPEPISEDGFQNSSEMLHMSVTQFTTYRESARSALKLATVPGDQPKPIYWSVSMKDAWDREIAKHESELTKIREKHKDDSDPKKMNEELERKSAELNKRPNNTYYQNSATDQFTRASWSYGGAKHAWEPTSNQPEVPDLSDTVAVFARNQKLIVELGDTVPDRGTLRVRVRAFREPRTKKDRGDPSLQLEFGWQASNDSHASTRVSKRDRVINSEEPKLYQWEIPLSEIYPRNSMRGAWKMGDLPSPSEYIKFVNSSVSQGKIHIDYVEVTAPVYETWPPPSHSRIFFDSENSSDESTYAEQVLSRFMNRAWRRNAKASEVAQKLALFEKVRPACDSFEEAIVEVFATVLSSPNFIYLLHQQQGAEEDSKVQSLPSAELATRLSMFLWCSTPDDTLLELSRKGTLNDDKVLRDQVDRMLADPRSRRFSEQFVRQWLGMQLLDYLDVDRKVYGQFNDSLKRSMQEEPIAFFHDVLESDRSVVDFIHADFTMANERLAKHYGLDDVVGNEFRRVDFEAKHQRGGLLTQAGLLAMNSDGKDSHPLKRGIWMLERLLNDPPPPPPPAVPEIDLADPEIAKMTLKERIEDHRNQAACMSCHVKIDPWGIAFENFDAVGSWRTTINEKPVDASSVLFNGQKLDGMDGLKRFLLKNRQDQFVRALAYKMTTFALGRPLTFGDRSNVDTITADVRKQGDGLATMVTAIVTSELFRTK